MNGVIVVNKEKGYTSRDVVNIVGKCLGTKKIGHTGTLDPMATGVLVLCVGKGLKLVEMMMNHDKEYIAKVKLGVETDTLDVTGKVLRRENVFDISREKVLGVLDSFIGKQTQVVPKYSAIKVNGKKLYEYARNGEDVELPVKDIEIYSIELIGDVVDNSFFIKCCVSKGTYIRSLVRDIGYKLGTIASLEELERISLSKFNISDSYTVRDIESGNYKLLNIQDVVDFPRVIVDGDMKKKVKNGQVMNSFFDGDKVLVCDDNEVLAIYQKMDNGLVKPYRMF